MIDILEQKLKISPETFANAVGDETVLLQIKRGVYFGLDPLGTQIWQGLAKGQSPRVICTELAREYATELSVVEQDARKFLEELKANEIVIVDES